MPELLPQRTQRCLSRRTEAEVLQSCTGSAGAGARALFPPRDVQAPRVTAGQAHLHADDQVRRVDLPLGLH